MTIDINGDRTLILDNGSYEIKALWSSKDNSPQDTISRIKVYKNGLSKYKNESTFHLTERKIYGYKENINYIKKNKFIGSKYGIHYNPYTVDDFVDYSINTEIDVIKDPTYFTRSEFEKGHLVNWEVEQYVWSYLFTSEYLNCDPWITNLVVTEPVLNPPIIQEFYDEIIFESFQFKSCLRLPSVSLSNFGINIIENEKAKIKNDLNIDNKDSIIDDEVSPCSIVVDIGHSFTYIVPFINNIPMYSESIRVDVGGKFLTNYLKEQISFKYFNMMDESLLVQQIKESCCYISNDFINDLNISKKTKDIKCIFSLPNQLNRGIGYLKYGGYFNDNEYLNPMINQPFINKNEENNRKRKATDVDEEEEEEPEQTLELNNERIVVPELLINPNYCGLNQAGLIESIDRAIKKLPEKYHGLLFNNIILTGGSSKFFGLSKRIEKDLKCLVNPIYNIRVLQSQYPDLFSIVSINNELHKENSNILNSFVTRDEYYEYGSKICAKKYST